MLFRSLADGAVAQPRALQLGARQHEHVRREVDADGAVDLVGENFQDAPGAGADVEQVGHLLAGDELGELALHLVVVDIEGAQFVPLHGDLAEVVLGPAGALAHQFLEALQIAQHRRVVVRQGVDQGLCQGRRRAMVGQAEIDPAALAVAVQQAGLGQQLQVARQPRLALAEDLDQVGDRQVGMGTEHQQTQARRLGSGLHGGQETLHRRPPRGKSHRSKML